MLEGLCVSTVGAGGVAASGLSDGIGRSRRKHEGDDVAPPSRKGSEHDGGFD